MSDRPKIKTWRGEPYKYAHLKRDGQLMFMSRNTSTMERVSLVTRIGTDITAQLVGHPTVQAFRQASPIDTVLLCELFAPGYPQSEVKHFLATGELDRLCLECFAVGGWYDDTLLEKCRDFCELIKVPFTPFLGRAELDRMADQDVEAWWRSALPDSEGVVFKDGNLLNWMKHKPEPTADLVVTGYTEGEGKYLGLIGAIVCRLYPFDKGFVKCSGMTDEVRRTISADRDGHLYKVVEVKYQYVGSQGGLRHPRFVRFRDDKRPEECTEL